MCTFIFGNRSVRGLSHLSEISRVKMIGNEKKSIAINFMLGQDCPNVKSKLTFAYQCLCFMLRIMVKIVERILKDLVF